MTVKTAKKKATIKKKVVKKATKKVVKKAVKKTRKTKTPKETAKKEQLRTTVMKKKLLAALEKTGGIHKPAYTACKCDMSTFYSYLKDDPEFAASVSLTENVNLDFGIQCLKNLVKAKKERATIEFVKILAHKRGLNISSQKISGTMANLNKDVSEMSEEEIDRELAELDAVRG